VVVRAKKLGCESGFFKDNVANAARAAMTFHFTRRKGLTVSGSLIRRAEAFSKIEEKFTNIIEC